jgi:hypothetical protein
MWGSFPARQGRREDRVAERGRNSDLRAGLAELVRTNVEQGRLSFGTALNEAVAVADAVFISVGTPPAAATAMPTCRGGPRGRRGAARVHRGHHQVHGSGWDRR